MACSVYKNDDVYILCSSLTDTIDLASPDKSSLVCSLLVTDAEYFYTSSVTYQDLNDFHSSHIPIDTLNHVLPVALQGKQDYDGGKIKWKLDLNSTTCTMTLLGFHQLGLSFQIGSLSLTRVPSDQHHQAWKRWLDITTSQSQSMAENQDALAKENALLTESNNKLHTMNEDLALQKTKNDRDIIGKFTELLNAKKRKIRELQAQLNHLPAEPALDHPPPSPPPARPRKKQKQRATTTASLSSPLSATQPVQHTSSASSAMKPAIASSSATSASSLGPSSSHISKASSSTAPVKISSFTVISDDDLDGDNLDDFDSLLNTSQAKTRKMANPKSKLNGKKPV